MNELILNYILQAILGGASGYITNDYAINMLFKEYTPFKIGGVIKKTRQEFIDNLSNLVENDIINKEKFQDILRDESFIKEFEDLTSDFYENCLYETVGDDTFAKIDDYNSTIKTTDIFTYNIIDEHMPDLYKALLSNLNLYSLLTSEQLSTMKKSLYSALTNIIVESNIIENTILSVYKNNENLILNNIINKNIYETVIENLINILLNESKKQKDKIDDILSLAGFNNALKSANEAFHKRKVKEVINIDNKILSYLNESLLTYINSDKGAALINSIINPLFTHGKECDKSVFELLDSSFKINLKDYLLSNIPLLTENIVDWVKENSHLIDLLIEESIDEVIKESDGLKAKLLSTIKNTYLNNLSEKYSIVDKIISYIKMVTEPEKLSDNITAKIIHMLNNLKVREILSEAESNNINSNSSINFIINYINKNSELLLYKTAEYISDIEIKKIVPEGLFSNKEIKTIINSLYEFSSSDKVRKYLTKKSTDYTSNNILSKELNCLISEKQAESFALKLKDFIIEKVTENEQQLKCWVENEIKTKAEELSNKELSSNAIAFLNDEIYKNYRKATDTLKNIPLTTSLDKLNSIDNLAKNSSESLRLFTVKNNDVILGGSIKTIVTDNLNKLNDNELVDLANDFIGRELKPIMFFGGVLGITAGLILATFQNSPLDLAKINIANMAVYAFVGYLTNVIAINMIFKPYRENKFLSKIPFLRNFSLGYIIKNQKTFAKNTANFIDNRLLSKESINLLFDKHKDKIKNSFIKSMTENEFKTLTSLLANNRNNVIKSFYSFLKNKFLVNKTKIGAFIYNKFTNIKINSLINNKEIHEFSLFIKERINASVISNGVHDFINSESSLNSKLSANMLKEFISNSENNYYNKLSEMLSDKDKLSSLLLKYNSTYEEYMNKQINELIGSEKIKSLSQSTAHKLSSVISDNHSRKQLTNKGLKIVNQLIDRNKTFEEMFDGKFKNYIDSQIPKILKSISTSILENTKNNKNKISLKVQSEIKNNLGFIEKSMYSLMGGDEIIDELITKIIIVKVPNFIEDKKLELQGITNNLLAERFYKTKVNALYTGLNNLQLNEIINNYLDQQSPSLIENKINNVTNILFSKAGNLKIKTILNPIAINGLKGLLIKYNNEINTFTTELSLNLRANKVQINAQVSDLTNSLIDEFMETQFENVFHGVSIYDINKTVDKFLEEINKNDLDKILVSSLEEAKENINLDASMLVDKNEFVKFTENYIISLCENTALEKTLKERIGSIIDKSISVNFNFIHTNTKNYILNIFIDSCILSLKRNLDKIFKSIEFDKIAKEEIEKMEPEKIHEMFNSFGGKYFKRLMVYGFGGFVFGINMYVGFSLTALKIISEKFNKNNR